MRKTRTWQPQPEMWEEADIKAYLNCDNAKAKEIMKEYHKQNGGRYGAVEKHLILDFINEKQRIEREREARYNADIAAARQVTALEEQVKALKEQSASFKEQISVLRESNEASSDDARKARTQSLVANFISGISAAIALVALVLGLI